jgi:HEAT repeat protein
MSAVEIQSALDSVDPEVRRRAVALIPDLPERDATDLVLRALGDSDWRVRKEAGQIAFLLGPSDALLHKLVGALFPGDNVGLRNAVVETLASFGRSAVPPVVGAIASLDADGKKLATEVLGRAHDPAAMPSLERLLYDGDANVRTAAVEAIGELGSFAVDAASRILVGALVSTDMHMRLASLEGLNRLGVVVPWEKLAPLMADRILRRAALAAASRSGRVEAAYALVRALDDESAAMFRLALIGLAELALGNEIPRSSWKEHKLSPGRQARDRMLQALSAETQDVEARRAALVVAAVVGESAAIDLAIDALIDDGVAREADAALRLFGPAALPRILARVAHGDALLRAAAIARLVELADKHSEDAVRMALRAAIADASIEVASAALTAIGVFGGPEDIAAVFAVVADRRQGSQAAAQSSLVALAKRYPDDARYTALVARRDQNSRIATSIIIGSLGGEVLGTVADDVAFLAGALSSPDPETRLSAVEAVGEVGSDLAMEAIEYGLADEEREIQLRSVRALGRLRTADGKAAGGDRLVELVRKENDPELTAAAVRALGDARDPRAQESLRPLAFASSPLIAVAAVETLGKLDDPARVDTLLEVLDHPHSEVVKAALVALEGVYDPRVLARYGEALSHQAWDIRRLAADCLARFGGPEAALLLKEKLSGEGEPLVREAMNRALGALEIPSTVRRPATIAPPKAET